jgi:serine/threonine-protein kinase
VITEEKEITPIKEIPEVNNALLTEIVPVKQPVKKTRSASPADLKKQLIVKTSDYSVGAFGGISNLEVKVYNASSHPVDKIVLSIQYMKPKGGVIETGLYEMYSIKPFSGRSLSIPDSKRGVKVKARIVEVRSKEIREI